MENLDTQTLDGLCARAVRISDRETLNQFCIEQNYDPTDLFSKARIYAKEIHDLKRFGVLQYGVPIESKPGPTVKMEFFGEKREMIMFASNDYLNLSTDPRVHESIIDALKNYGVGAGSSRVGTGYSYLHRELEEQLAASFGKEAAILFPTGYDAIAAPAISLLGPKDRVFIDGSSHACILDGAYTSGATVRVFAHNQPDRLEDALRRAKEKVTDGGFLVMVEGAYSMDGDIADLPNLVAVCRKYGAKLMVDEAHSIGVHGSKGHGACEHHGVQKQVDFIGGTFSKSLGATGGFVAADKDVITYLNYMSRKIIFSAALPPILVAGVKKALEIMETDHGLREQLWANVHYLAAGMKQIGAKVLGTGTASVPVLIGNDGIMFRFTRELIQNGIFTFPAVYPTVPRNRSLFRLALQTKHSKADLDKTIDVFSKLLKKYNVT